MNTLIIAETVTRQQINWPEAFAAVGMFACFVFMACTIVTGEWPWHKK